MTAKAYWINAAMREITEITFDDTSGSTADMRTLIGCEDTGFCLGWMFNGDPLYVDDKGLFKPQRHFFQIVDRADPQPLPGNGLMTGRDRMEEGSYDPRMSLAQLRGKIRFLSRAQADAWAVRHAKQASTLINGEPIETWEQTWRQMPYAAEEPEIRMILPDGQATAKTVWEAIEYARVLPRLSLKAITDAAGVMLLSETDIERARQ